MLGSEPMEPVNVASVRFSSIVVVVPIVASAA